MSNSRKLDHRNHGKQTDSHNIQQLSTSNEKLSTSEENLTTFIESWKNYDRAGSLLVSSICKDLSDNQSDDLESILGSSITGTLFSGSVSEQALGHLKELENLMTTPKQSDRKPKCDLSKVFQALLLLMKLQIDYHKQCSQSLTSLIEQLVHTCDKQENSELYHHLQSLELHKYVSSRQSPSRSFGLKKSSSAGSGSPKPQKHSIKASLFSFFERKNSPDEGNSSFYVDLDQQGDDETSQSEPLSHPEKVDNGQSETLIQLGLDPDVSKEKSANILSVDSGKDALVTVPGAPLLDGLEPPQMSTYQSLSPGSASQGSKPCLNSGAAAAPNGHVASQEELDSVINLLSGVGTGSYNHMSPIPEQHSQVSLQVPSVYSSLSPAASESGMDGAKTQRNQSQRRSEGSLDLTGFENQGRNTWPHQHRSSLPGVYLVSQVQYDHMNTAHTRNYMPENRPAMTLPPGGANHLPPGYQWSFPDPKLNRAWPVNNLAGSSTWSAGQDSDDPSDDDSSSDQLYNIPQQLQPNRISMDDTVSLSKKTSQDTGGRHHSFDDLLDGHSSEAWQASLQPWSQFMKGKDPVMSHDKSHDMTRNPGYHRPLTMQWSDPLTSRNIWPSAGLENQGQIQSQPSHGFGGKI